MNRIRLHDAEAAAQRARRYCWSAPNCAQVSHPEHDTVVVPCRSMLGALLCAAEVWDCDWLEVRDAAVMWAPPDIRPVRMPERSNTASGPERGLSGSQQIKQSG